MEPSEKAAHLSRCVLRQGTSQTMEDALELGRALALHGPTPEALRAYETVRQAFIAPIDITQHCTAVTAMDGLQECPLMCEGC